MTLVEFLNYRPNCPLCNSSLQTRFHSERQQVIRFEEDRIDFHVNMDGMTAKEKDYKVTYSFGLHDDSFKLEFYRKGQIQNFLDSAVPIDILKRFKELNQNLSLAPKPPSQSKRPYHDAEYKIYRCCRICNKYQYSSAHFKLHLEKAKYEIPAVATEYFGMYQKVKGTYKVYRLFNYYSAGVSTIQFGRFDHDWIVDLQVGSPPERLDTMETPLIEFVSAEETMKRLNTLIIFS
jgi:hypothetical protein